LTRSKGYLAEKIAANTKAKSPASSLARAAAKAAFAFEVKKQHSNTDRLVDFIPSLSPELQRPYYLEKFCELLEESGRTGGVRAVVAAPPQHGKALKQSETMLTDRGWITAGEVKVGDSLIGSDGKWTKVIGVFPQGVKDLNRVSFTDGTSLVTCDEHLWQVHNRYSGRPMIRSTEQLSTDLTESDERCKWRIPIVKPITGHDEELPIEPYFLGLWLGDGYSANSGICSMDWDVAVYLKDYADRLGMILRVDTPLHNRAGTWKISNPEPRGPNKLTQLLRDAGLINNKHIPDEYMFANQAVRLAVLQGMCDTDGTVAKNGSQQSYCTTSPRLAQDFKTLVASLGGVCTEVLKETGHKLAYNLYFRLPEGMAGFRLERKQSRLTAYTPRHVPRRFIKSIEPAGRGEAVCFMVDAPDSLYCAGRDLIVTHNTMCVLHALCWLAIKYPGKKHAYITYSTERAESVSTQFQELAALAGLEPEGRLSDVKLKGGTLVRFISIGGSLTGHTVNGLMIIDDPIKDRADAESPTLRRRTYEWFTSTARSRRQASTSIICMATRWHPEDLSGELIRAKQPYPYLNFKAIAEGPVDENGRVIGDPNGRKPGEALFPEFKPPEFFAEEQADDYDWQSLYQGEPRGRGNSVFQWPDMASKSLFYTPSHAIQYERLSIGLDFAYTAKTSSDYSVAVVIGEYKGDLHLVDMVRLQVEPREFRDRVRLLLATYPGATATAHVAATEKGGVEFMRDAGLDIDGLVAKQDKFLRAVPTAAAWNQGRFKLPDKSDWLNVFLNEVCTFTGLKDKHDDIVDAFAAAFDGLGPPPATYRPKIHTNVVGDYAEIGLG